MKQYAVRKGGRGFTLIIIQVTLPKLTLLGHRVPGGCLDIVAFLSYLSFLITYNTLNYLIFY